MVRGPRGFLCAICRLGHVTSMCLAACAAQVALDYYSWTSLYIASRVAYDVVRLCLALGSVRVYVQSELALH